MRVLHVYSGNLYGGVETFLVALARQRSLCPDLEAHYAVCFTGRLSKELTGASTPVHCLGPARISRPWTVWRARRQLSQLLARESFDVAICHGCWPHVLFGSVIHELGLPLVFWSHDAPTGQHWLERRAKAVRPDLVLTNSRWTLDQIPKLFADVHGEVLHYPVPEPETVDRLMVRRQVRALLETPDNVVVIIQSSRLEQWKGHQVLLQALEHVPQRPVWQCWIAGGAQRPHESSYLTELQATAARLGIADRVRFLGQRTDVTQLLAAADIHCQPNTGPEPFGIAFVEALYAGLPVVATAMGGALEIINEKCGCLVPPGSPDLLAGELCRLISDQEARMALGAAGPARARELCEPATQMRKLSTLLSRVIRQGVATCRR
jgi:glycosyltransferase involved in cell wall biosynthesis